MPGGSRLGRRPRRRMPPSPPPPRLRVARPRPVPPRPTAGKRMPGGGSRRRPTPRRRLPPSPPPPRLRRARPRPVPPRLTLPRPTLPRRIRPRRILPRPTPPRPTPPRPTPPKWTLPRPRRARPPLPGQMPARPQTPSGRWGRRRPGPAASRPRPRPPGTVRPMVPSLPGPRPAPLTVRLLTATRPSPLPPRSRAARPDMLEEALEPLVRGIVDHPDDVRVNSHGLRRGRVLEVRVHPEDLGKVIGRGGRTARALRTVIGSLAGGRYVRVDLLDVDEVR